MPSDLRGGGATLNALKYIVSASFSFIISYFNINVNLVLYYCPVKLKNPAINPANADTPK